MTYRTAIGCATIVPQFRYRYSLNSNILSLLTYFMQQMFTGRFYQSSLPDVQLCHMRTAAKARARGKKASSCSGHQCLQRFVPPTTLKGKCDACGEELNARTRVRACRKHPQSLVLTNALTLPPFIFTHVRVPFNIGSVRQRHGFVTLWPHSANNIHLVGGVAHTLLYTDH